MPSEPSALTTFAHTKLSQILADSTTCFGFLTRAFSLCLKIALCVANFTKMAQSPRPIEVSIRQGRRKPMSSPSLHHSVYSDIEYAVCLLALVVNRPPPPNEVAADPVSESKGDGVEEIEDLQNINVEGDGQQHLFELRSKVLDRLAETLARFKSDPHSDPKGITLRDAKHVSSAAMIVYTEQEKVKVLCSKNEGLDKEDEIFLGNWKTCMEAIAKTGEVN